MAERSRQKGNARRAAQGRHYASADQEIRYIQPVDVSKYSDSPYSRGNYQATLDDSRRHGQNGNRRRKKGHPGLTVLIVLLVLAALGGGGAYLWFNPPFFQVSVNGSRYTVNAGTTIKDAIDKGYASPKAGNLIAVDGSVATEGGGELFTATLNGTSVNDPSTKLTRDATLEISDGGDTTESYTETTETIPHTTSNAATTASSYYNGSIHIFSDGEDGEQVTRTGDVSGKTVTTVTKQAVSGGYHTYTANVGNDKVVALTFDDGPWPTSTSEILDILNANGAHATFFEIGNQIANNSDVVKKLYESGNQIGSHSWDHAAGSGQGVNMTYMTADEQVSEVTKGFDAIDGVVGTKVSRVFRAPGGNYYGSLIETLHPYVTAEVGWDVDTKDWSRPGVDAIVSAIESVKPGQIILMHDGGGDRTQSVEALKTALPVLKSQGYSFVTIDELLAYGITSS